MSDRDVPTISGSKSFDDAAAAIKNSDADEEYKNRTYSLDASLSTHNNEEDVQEDMEDEDDEEEEDEEIRLAKEMAIAIAQNPNMTPDQLRQFQEESKKRAAAVAATAKSRKKKGVKALRSSFKAGVKKVSSVATGRKSPHRPSSASSVSTVSASPAVSVSSKTADIPTSSDHKVPALSSSPLQGGNKVAISPRVADFAEEKKGNSTNLAASSGMTKSTDDSSIRLTGIVWKRRSGLGKYSSNAAWERRRVVLEGTKLLYYKTSALDNDDTSVDEMNPEGDVSAADPMAAGSSNWLGMRSSGSSSSKPAARGDFDLLKDQASVSASYGHTGAPTPFALSIKVLGQTKWKLCFDTHEELMEWLAAMTDVVVQGSVDSYNALILEAHDPRNHVGGTSGGGSNMYGQLSEPPRNLSPQYADTHEDAGGHRLWATGHYNVKSVGFPVAAIEEMEDILEDVDSDDDDDVQVAEAGNSLIGKVDEPPSETSSSTAVFTIQSNQLVPMVVVLNIALCLSRASTVSPEMFWHLITFTNVALLSIFSKELIGATSKPTGGSIKVTGRKTKEGAQLNDTAKIVQSASKDSATTSLVIPEPNDDYKPVAGTTTIEIENPTDLPVKDGIIFGGWRTADPATMLVRSVGYKKHKKKCASPGELYKCIHMDIFESRTRYPDMASRVTLPDVDFQDKGPKTWNAPDLFVITIAIPTDPPKLYGSADNGGGYTLTLYFKMNQETRDILRRVTADGYNPVDEKAVSDPNTSKVNAVRLLEEWCRRAPTDDNFMARFKVVPNAQNLKEIGLPSWIAKYNGKPFLIKRPGQTGFLYRHPEKSCIEFDISLHPFPYLAKQGICYMKDTFFKKVLVTFGFLIEGRSDDELPECLIGLFQLCYPDPQHAIQGEDFFAGTSPRSF